LVYALSTEFLDALNNIIKVIHVVSDVDIHGVSLPWMPDVALLITTIANKHATLLAKHAIIEAECQTYATLRKVFDK
jgi:hypothetical protein